MSLPAAWVDKIFDKLTLVYGRDFLARWEAVDLNLVKSDWAHELAGFERFPEGIAHALTHLDPVKPPTVLQFRDMARKAPRSEDKQLPVPKADPAVVAEQLKRLAPVLKRMEPRGDKEWANRLKARHEDGGQLSRYQINCYRRALGMEGRQAWQ